MLQLFEELDNTKTWTTRELSGETYKTELTDSIAKNTKHKKRFFGGTQNKNTSRYKT